METLNKKHIPQRIQRSIKMTNSGKRQTYSFRNAMMAAVAVAVLAVGCDIFAPPPAPGDDLLPEKKCVCPNGIVHFEDEACCPGGKTKDCYCTTKPRPQTPQVPTACTHGEAEYLPGNHQTLPHGADCKCKNIPGTVVNTIPVTNRTDQLNNFNTTATRVGDAFTMLADLGPEYAAMVPIVKNNIKEITIIPVDSTSYPITTSPSGAKYVMTIMGKITDAGNIATAFYNFVTNNPQLTAAVQQESAKNTVRLAMHGNKPTFDFDFRTNTVTVYRMASAT
jgi:hypothetical protein